MPCKNELYKHHIHQASYQRSSFWLVGAMPKAAFFLYKPETIFFQGRRPAVKKHFPAPAPPRHKKLYRYADLSPKVTLSILKKKQPKSKTKVLYFFVLAGCEAQKKKYSKQPGLRWICFQNRLVGRPRCGLSRSRRAGLLCPKLTPETKSSLKTVRNCQKAGTRKKNDFFIPLFPHWFFFPFWSKSRPYLHKNS